MKNYLPNYLSMLVLMFVCIVSCSNETTSDPGFEIGGTPAETVYQIPSDRKVRLPGTGFQTGDVVRLTDTGISHNTYRVEAAVEEDGAVITLPGNFVDGQYELFIVRGTRQFRYGRAVFRADSNRPGELDRPDYDRLTADRHPRLLMDDEAFGSLMEQVRAGNNQVLNRLHATNLRNADIYGLAAAPLAYQLDAAEKRILHISSAALLRIFSCAYAYRATGDRKYLDHAENDINTVCNFPDWNGHRHYLDVGEMAAGVALGYDWLYADLKPETRANAERALREYAFDTAEPYGSSFYNKVSNWNQVCNAGLVCGALAVYETCPETAEAIIEKSLESNRTAIEALYAPHGNYPEGYGYWEYGTVFNVLMLTALETAAGSDAGISATAGFDRTAEWMLYMVGTTRQGYNYADYPQTTVGADIPSWYFADKFKKPSLLYYNMECLKGTTTDYYIWNHRLLPMIMVFASRIDLSSVTPPTQKVWAGEGETPVVLVHTDWTWSDTDKYLGVKGGKARSSHAHMDAGSFVYDAYGVRWSMDIGRQAYAPLEVALKALGGNLWTYTQASLRWEVSRLNNFFHSTLTVNDSKHRVEGFATLEQTINTATEQGATFDLSPVLEDQVASAKRTVKIVDDKDLKVIDAIHARTDRSAKIRWTMATPAVPTVENDRIVLTSRGKTMYLTAAEEGETRIVYKTFSTDPVHSYDDPNPGIYLVGFEATVPADKWATFTTTLSPGK